MFYPKHHSANTRALSLDELIVLGVGQRWMSDVLEEFDPLFPILDDEDDLPSI